MIDVTQLLLLAAILSLTVTLAVVGYQVFHILKEVRLTLRKVDRILDDVGAVTTDVRRPIHVASSLASGLEFVTKIVDMVKKDVEPKPQIETQRMTSVVEPMMVEETTDSIDEFVSDDVMPPHITRVQSQGRRFFFKKKNV